MRIETKTHSLVSGIQMGKEVGGGGHSELGA